MKKLQIKRGPKAGLPILEQGEFGYALDTNELYIGVLAEPTSPNDNVLVNELTDLSAYSTTSQMNAAIDAAALALGTNYAVANIAARDNLEDLVVGDMVFVTDDGDTKWAQYKVTGIGPVVFTKIMDQDALINAIDGPGIKAAYESNADTNAFTDALQTKLTTTDVFDNAGTYANLRAQGTTKGDVGLGSVENYAVASQAEAEAGSVNDKYMTPLRTSEAIAELAPTPVIATKEEAEAGSINDKFMTPLRTSEAIAELVDFDFGLFLPPDDPFGTPGPQGFVASTESNGEIAGFFGQVTQEDFGITMTQVMSDLGINQGTAQFTDDGLLKFIHRGKIKFINRRTIRHSITWNHIQDRLVANGGNVYGGATMTFGGHSYKVRLMRGWGQVSANTDGTGTPNYETGPLMTISFATGSGGNFGVNWPTNTSGWSANNPNEWNTLIFPIASAGQSQTSDVPNWASYSNADLQVGSGNGKSTWTQETINTSTPFRVYRGYLAPASAYAGYSSHYYNSNTGLRLVFEHISGGE